MPPKKSRKQVYTKAEKVAKGTIITDVKRKEWIIGDLLGEGGFGFIYLVKKNTDSEYKQVVKIEPSTNGPMFTEINFYRRVCIESDIEEWISKKKLKHLGMPRFITSGTQLDVDNRFLIMDRYGRDLHYTLTHQNISASTIFQITINVLDVLEYIHSHGYVHADIKALNILKDYKMENKIYLLDFGMVSQYIDSNGHKPDKIDKKRQHNGTLDFCPRDSHIGRYSSRRSDIESLLYNLIYWLTWDMGNSKGTPHVGYGKLPWMSLVIDYNKTNNNSILNKVADIKEQYMSDSDLFVNSVDLSNVSYSNELKQMIDKINQIPYESAPDYDSLRRQLVNMYCISKEIKCPITKYSIDFNKYRAIEWNSSSSNVLLNTRKRRSSTRKCDEENKSYVKEHVSKPKAKRTKCPIESSKDKNNKKNMEATKFESVEAKTNSMATKVTRRKKIVNHTEIEEVVNFSSTTRTRRNKKIEIPVSEEDLFDNDSAKENINLNESDLDKSFTVPKRKLIKRPHNTEDNCVSKRKSPNVELEVPKLKQSTTKDIDTNLNGSNKRHNNANDSAAKSSNIKIPALNSVPYKTKSSKADYNNQNKVQTSFGVINKTIKLAQSTSESRKTATTKDVSAIIPGLSSLMKENLNAAKK